jgi:hypothetical protein
MLQKTLLSNHLSICISGLFSELNLNRKVYPISIGNVVHIKESKSPLKTELAAPEHQKNYARYEYLLLLNKAGLHITNRL